MSTSSESPALASTSVPNPNPYATSTPPPPPRSGGGSSGLPPLRAISPNNAARLAHPALRIKTDADVAAWARTRGYADYALFLRRLADAVVGCALPYADPEPDAVRPQLGLCFEQWLIVGSDRASAR